MKSNSKETDRIKKPLYFAIKFANTVFMLGILFSVLVFAYSVYKIYTYPQYSSTFYYSFLLFALLTSILFGLGLRKLSDELKLNISVMFITLGISVYGFETYLMFSSTSDPKSKFQVLKDLKDSGINAWPNFAPWTLIESNGLKTFKGRIFPLGGISNITTIFKDESGYFPIIETDEHGFNNPKGFYQLNKVDIVLTGDSFTEGVSVHSDETISAVLRESGFNSISIGKMGNGSLLELAALKEYAKPFKPKIVLWLYFINDFNELKNEMESSILKKYLNEDDFTQNLISRQEEIDSLLFNYVGKEWEKEKERPTNQRVFKFLKLFYLRSRMNMFPVATTKPTTKLPIFKDILQKSKQMVQGWGGKMYFVYLPPFERFSTGIEDTNREFVLDTVSELEIPIIDIYKEVFIPRADPMSLFPSRMGGHYNAEGYRLVAKSISNILKADGIITLNSKN